MDEDLASDGVLQRLKSLYPVKNDTDPLTGAWYIVAAVAYASSNRPEGVPAVFKFVLGELEQKSATREEKLRLARRMRDAMFKGGMICGYSRAINGLVALHEAMPEELRDTQMLRDVKGLTVAEMEERGRTLYQSMYGETSAQVQGLLDAIYPDMGFFSNTIAYGLVYGHEGQLTQAEASFSIVTALIALDTPRQVRWHLDNSRRGGATVEETQAVRAIAMNVAQRCGIVWKDGVPEV